MWELNREIENIKNPRKRLGLLTKTDISRITGLSLGQVRVMENRKQIIPILNSKGRGLSLFTPASVIIADRLIERALVSKCHKSKPGDEGVAPASDGKLIKKG